MRYVYVSPIVEQRIQRLKSSGKTGGLLAEKTLQIISDLTSKKMRYSSEMSGSLTRYGENRLKKCLKINLGNGYRLIFFYRNGHILVSYLGTHDECQRWLKTHTSLKTRDSMDEKYMKILRTEPDSIESNDLNPVENECSVDGSIEISDKDLRFLFSGLVDGARKNKKYHK